MNWPESNIKIFTRRNYRILRIWYCGKLPYAKRFRRWMNGQLLRDLDKFFPDYYQTMLDKYGDKDFLQDFYLGKKGNHFPLIPVVLEAI
jgi:hypothetical protein